MAQWAMVNGEGLVVCVLSRPTEAAVQAALRPGCTLVDWDAGLDPRRVRRVGGTWETVAEPARPYDVMRRSGYHLGDQAGAIMKLLEALVADPAIAALVPAPVMAEFQASVDNNAAVKAAHPKP